MAGERLQESFLCTPRDCRLGWRLGIGSYHKLGSDDWQGCAEIGRCDRRDAPALRDGPLLVDLIVSPAGIAEPWKDVLSNGCTYDRCRLRFPAWYARCELAR